MKQNTLHIFLVALMIVIGNTVLAQNSGPTYGTQFENRGFENWSEGQKDEPYHWHSTQTATGTYSGMLPSGVIKEESHSRPGTTGSKSAKILAKKVLGSIIANGNITNGRMNAGSMSATGNKNYNYTDSDESLFNTQLNGNIPDSITMWIHFYTKNSGVEGKMYSALHKNTDFKYISNASISSANDLHKAAFTTFTRTTSSNSDFGTDTWKRISVRYGENPENSNCPATGSCSAADAKCVLMVVTTNREAGKGSDGDFLCVDDVLLIYNPTLTTGALAKSEYNVGEQMTIPFTITGTMSPDNLNAAKNQVIAELSNASGSFANPTTLGSVTTDVSGSITVTLPNNISDGTGYRVRVRSTNYPKTAADNGSNIKINGCSNLYASVTPNGSGTINLTNGTNYGASSEGQFINGTTVNISATPNTGYDFVKWTENGSQLSTDANYSFTMNGDKTIVANFSKKTYTITATASPTAGGSVSGAGTFEHGASCTLTATPNTGYIFSSWTKNGQIVSTTAITEITVYEDATYTANFTKTYTITVTTTEGGTATGGGTYIEGTTAMLNATANEGYTFINWTSNNVEVATDASYSFTVNKDATYKATFKAQYTIIAEANPENGGTVTGSGTYNAGDEVTLTATANQGYVFVNWTKDGNPVSTNTSITFSANANATYTANFAGQHTITVVANPDAGGTVSGGGTYNDGTNVSLTATPSTGYAFVNWTKDGQEVSTTAITEITVSENATYIANFARTFVITVINTEGGTSTGGGTYIEGNSATLAATPNEGFVFVNWTKNDVEISTEATYSFEVTENATFTANFDIATYNITVEAHPDNAGTVTGGGTFEHGTTCTLSATANTGYTFTNWTKNDTVVSINATYTFPATASGEYIANFEIATYDIAIEVSPTEGGSVTGAGTYEHGYTATLTATAASGYVFVNWTKDGQEVSTDVEYSFEVTESGTYVANFATEETITVNTNNNEAGSVSGGGTYAYGQEITISATANVGYSFVNWTLNGVEVSTNADYTFTVTEDATYIANFEVATYTISVNANPSAGGSVSGAGVYTHGENVTITATANEGYNFINWTKNGTLMSENATETFTATESATYQANFAEEEAPTIFTITAAASSFGTITPSGDVTVPLGANQTFVFTPDEHYQLQEIQIDNVTYQELENENEYTFYNVTENHSILVFFEKERLNVNTSVNIEEGGTVSNSRVVLYGEVITLVAEANTGYEFVNWTDEEGNVVSETASFELTVVEDVNYTANFVKVWTITVITNNDEAGTATGGGVYQEGETATLTASANSGYVFVNWTIGENVVSTSTSLNVTVTEDATYTANFVARYRIIVSATQGGTATGGGYYNDGTEITIHAAATTEDYFFTNWSMNGIDVSTQADYTFTVTENATYIANFVQRFVITAVAGEGGSVSPAGPNTYNAGETVILTATPDNGYAFVGWTKNDNVVSTNTTFTFNATENATYTANFVRTYTITVNTTEGGNATGGGTYITGETATLEATPTTGYVFVNWTDENDAVVSSNAIYSFNVTGDATLTANFAAVYVIAVNSTEGGNATGGGTYNAGETATLTATADEGYLFVNWTKDDEEVSTDEEYSFVVTESGTYTANFIQQFMIEAIAGEGGSVSPEGRQTYNAGETVTLTATPDDDHIFDNWTNENGNIMSTDEEYSFVANGNGTYTANFIAKESIIFTITAIAGEHGSISPSGEIDVTYGQNMTFTITPDPEYNILSLLVDGEEVALKGSPVEYTFENITSNHSIEAVFKYNSIETAETDTKVELYPNPTSRVININGDDITEIRIYNMNGVLVKHEYTNGNSTIQISVGDFAAGIYTVQCIGTDKVTTRNFVKK